MLRNRDGNVLEYQDTSDWKVGHGDVSNSARNVSKSSTSPRRRRHIT